MKANRSPRAGTTLTPTLAAVAAMQDDERPPIETREDLAMVRRNIALEVR